ncbi:hypothetical protein NESM_000832900 [Novymonas esmeraldas]|uniref:DRBM domain-containing protein n=1 Tax=Novymonas esmeraldas TaxID=1808958 RepID=A0AAW0EYS5_9TRYP
MSRGTAAAAAVTPPPPPPPEEPLTYPITFAKLAEEDDLQQKQQQQQSSSATAAAAQTLASSSMRHISIFSSLHWLRPIYELAEWMPPSSSTTTTAPHSNRGDRRGPADAAAVEVSADTALVPFDDVRAALQLLPLFDKFFVEGSKIIPQHTELYYFIESFALPTPKGPKVVTRSKVEGDHRATHQPSHAPATAGAAGATTKTTVTNSTACFSLLPGHNQFLLYYEEREKLRHCNYLQLDRLRFAWVAVKELLEESKVFHLHDGSLTGFARRDLKKNNAASPFCIAAPSTPVVESSSPSGGGGGGGGASSKVVGRGGGNARLHQGTSGNVITGPSKDVMEEKKRVQQLRFLREELEQECQRRWPYTPVAKSCLFSVEEMVEAELPTDALEQLGLVGAHNLKNAKSGQRRGPRYYLATVELPLLNKKGGAARFKAPRWWNNRRDAESAAAEATLLALRNLKA